jgi:hypothetical protein
MQEQPQGNPGDFQAQLGVVKYLVPVLGTASAECESPQLWKADGAPHAA